MLMTQLKNSVAWRFIVDIQEVFWIALIVATFVLVKHVQQQQRLELVKQPQVNDFFLVDYAQIDSKADQKYRYLPLKITNLTEHTLSYVAGTAGHSQQVGINDHIKFDAPMNYNFFAQREVTISRSQFQQWAQQGIIYDVARPERFYINGWIVLSPHEVLRGYKINARFQSTPDHSACVAADSLNAWVPNNGTVDKLCLKLPEVSFVEYATYSNV